MRGSEIEWKKLSPDIVARKSECRFSNGIQDKHKNKWDNLIKCSFSLPEAVRVKRERENIERVFLFFVDYCWNAKPNPVADF